jgi:hypothetical protein
MAIVIQIRRDIAANWTSVNPLLAQGEWGEELDTLKFKVGDGVLRWNALPYVIPSSDATTASNIGAGTGVFSSKAINDLQFKSLVGANGVTISSGVNTITISGGGTAIYDHNALNNLDYASANHTGFASTVALTTTSGYILTYVSNNYIDNSEMTVISGNILTYVSNNYIDNSEMATISGNIMTNVSNNYIDNSEMATISGNIVSKIITAHSGLSGLSNDDHPQYILANGIRAFTSTVSGVTPTLAAHLTTKQYVDSQGTLISGAIIKAHSGLTGLSSDDHTQYILANGTRAFTSTVSGVTPTQNAHLTTKQYVDNAIAVVSGSIDDHNELHNIQGGASSDYYHLTYVQYTDLTDSGNATIHKHDDRYYTETEVDIISGALNTKLDNHKTSSDHDGRYYTETEVNVISGALNSKIITDHGNLTGLSDDDHLQYSLVNGTRAFTNTVSGVYPTTDNHLSTKKYVDDNTIFGDGFNYATSAGVSVTTSDSFQTKLTLTTSTLVSGTYRIGVSYGWNYDSAADDFESRVLFDGGQIGATHNEEPSDSGGTSWSGTGTDQRHYISRTFYTTVTGSLTHTVTLEYRATVAGTSAGIWDAVIELWRVR